MLAPWLLLALPPSVLLLLLPSQAASCQTQCKVSAGIPLTRFLHTGQVRPPLHPLFTRLQALARFPPWLRFHSGSYRETRNKPYFKLSWVAAIKGIPATGLRQVGEEKVHTCGKVRA